MAWQAPNWSVVHIVEALIGSNSDQNKTKPKIYGGWKSSLDWVRYSTRGGCFWSGRLIYQNMTRYYKSYAYKGNQGRQATTMLSEVGQGDCISEKQIQA